MAADPLHATAKGTLAAAPLRSLGADRFYCGFAAGGVGAGGAGLGGSEIAGLGTGLDGAAGCRGSGLCSRGAWGAIVAGAGLAAGGTTAPPRFAPSPRAIRESEFSFPLGSRF